MPRINLLRGVPTKEQREDRARKRAIRTIEDAAWQWNYSSDESPLPEIVLLGEHVLHIDENGFIMEDHQADQEISNQRERLEEMLRKTELEWIRDSRRKPTDPLSIESLAFGPDAEKVIKQGNSNITGKVGCVQYEDEES